MDSLSSLWTVCIALASGLISVGFTWGGEVGSFSFEEIGDPMSGEK